MADTGKKDQDKPGLSRLAEQMCVRERFAKEMAAMLKDEKNTCILQTGTKNREQFAKEMADRIREEKTRLSQHTSHTKFANDMTVRPKMAKTRTSCKKEAASRGDNKTGLEGMVSSDVRNKYHRDPEARQHHSDAGEASLSSPSSHNTSSASQTAGPLATQKEIEKENIKARILEDKLMHARLVESKVKEAHQRTGKEPSVNDLRERELMAAHIAAKKKTDKELAAKELAAQIKEEREGIQRVADGVRGTEIADVDDEGPSRSKKPGRMHSLTSSILRIKKK